MSTDIKLDFLDQAFDLQITNNDLLTEDGLKTAVIISLFSDRRVTDEELPIEETSRRGWWADALNDDNDQIGSKLWLLKREKITPQLVSRIQTYCEESLQWLIDDKIADRVNVITERAGLYQVSIEIEILRPHDTNMSHQFSFVWESLKNDI